MYKSHFPEWKCKKIYRLNLQLDENRLHSRDVFLPTVNVTVMINVTQRYLTLNQSIYVKKNALTPI